MVRYVLHCIDLAFVIIAYVIACSLKKSYLGPYSGLAEQGNYFLVLLVLLFY